MRLVTYSLLFRNTAAIFLSSLILSGCGDSPTDEPAPAETSDMPVSQGTTAEAPTEILPGTGQISTSAPGVPTTQITQTQPRSQVPPQAARRVQLTPEQQEQVVNQVMANQAKAQAAGLGNGFAKVNRAWNYVGFSTLELDKGSTIPARLVAVDLTVEGHTVNFDYDDVEIIDGVTGISYGSDPFAVFLDKDGKPLDENVRPPVAPEAVRVLLVYAFPKATPTFSLAYWHKNLIRQQRITIEEEGWSVPYPKNSGVQ